MRPFIFLLSLATLLAATAVHAGDADAGRRLAQDHCATCHATGRWQGEGFADAPPFAVIARKFAGSGDLMVALRGPRHKMNFWPSQAEANDIAEYIRSLAH
jgi:mono/diheme cytochrome c family protein